MNFLRLRQLVREPLSLPSLKHAHSRIFESPRTRSPTQYAAVKVAKIGFSWGMRVHVGEPKEHTRDAELR